MLCSGGGTFRAVEGALFERWRRYDRTRKQTSVGAFGTVEGVHPVQWRNVNCQVGGDVDSAMEGCTQIIGGVHIHSSGGRVHSCPQGCGLGVVA